jgi:hypothetical protein
VPVEFEVEDPVEVPDVLELLVPVEAVFETLGKEYSITLLKA